MQATSVIVGVLQAMLSPESHPGLAHTLVVGEPSTVEDGPGHTPESTPRTHRFIRMWFGLVSPAVLITHCSLVQEAVKIPKEKFTYRFIMPLLGSDGFVTAEGEQWVCYHHIMTPATSSRGMSLSLTATWRVL